MATSAAEGCSEKAAYWTEHVTAWRKSGLSQGAYCRRHGLSQSSLSYWRKRLGATDDREAAPCVTIVPVPLLASALADMATVPGVNPTFVSPGIK